jgi:hypothetical protein
LYHMVCTGWILGTNESYQPVQMPVFLVVSRAFVLATVGGPHHDAEASMFFVLQQVSWRDGCCSPLYL